MALQDTIEKDWEKAEEQQKELLACYNNGTPIDLIVTKEATDERPTVNLKSDRFPNWEFRLNRRFCVAGFLHQLKAGMTLQLYIQNFGNSQRIFCSYFKKDNLEDDKRNDIINELKKDLKDNVIEQISYCSNSIQPKKVNIETVLNDHIIVEYKGLYGTITNADLFHDKSDYYKELKGKDGTMKVYVNSIDETGNVRFSETRLPELINNPLYKGHEKTEKKWNNDISLSEYNVGEETEGLIWQHMRNIGIFVICKTKNGDYIQCLMPNTALYKWEYHEWNNHFKIGTIQKFKIISVNEEEKKLTLAAPEITTLKYKEEYIFEKTTTLETDILQIEEGQLIDIILMAGKKEDDNILYARTDIKVGDYFIGGYCNIEEDLPEVLSYYTTTDKLGRKKRNILNGIISYTPHKKYSIEHIKLPAIAHIEDGHYRFSIMDAINKCVIEDLPESDFKDNFKVRREKVEVVYSWHNATKNVDYVVFRWKNLFNYMHVDYDDKILLTKGKDFYSGMKVNIWIKGINRDLTFDADAYNPYLSWNTLRIKKGDLISTREFWLDPSSNIEIYKTKYLGCSVDIMPGFNPDEKSAYTFRVVYINKNDRFMLLDYIHNDNERNFVTKDDIQDNVLLLNPVCPLGDNYFLMTYQEKFCIMKSSTAGAVLIQAIYNHFILNNKDLHPYAFFSSKFKENSIYGNDYFEWTGDFKYSTFSWPLNAFLSEERNNKGVPIKKLDHNGFFKEPIKNVDLKCYVYEHKILKKEDRVRFTGKFIVKRVDKSETGKIATNVIYPLFTDVNRKTELSTASKIDFSSTRKRPTNTNLLEDSKQYVAEISNLYKGEIKIWANKEQFTYYYLNSKVLPGWFSSKSEIEEIKESKFFSIDYGVKKTSEKNGHEHPKPRPTRILSDEQKKYRSHFRKTFPKSSQTEYLFQVITKYPADEERYIPYFGEVAGYIINAEKYGKEDALVGIISNDENRILPLGNISENDIFPVYYDNLRECFSITPSKELIQQRYKEMRFIAKIVRQEEDRIILKSNGKEYYALLNNEINKKSLLNQFGFTVVPDMTVYISPTERNNEWPKEDNEVYIWKPD